MIATIDATEAEARFAELMRQVVEEQTAVVVERDGKAQIAILPAEEYERLRAGEPEQGDWWELARQSRERIHRERIGRPLPNIEDLIHDMREERDAQLLANLRRR